MKHRHSPYNSFTIFLSLSLSLSTVFISGCSRKENSSNSASQSSGNNADTPAATVAVVATEHSQDSEDSPGQEIIPPSGIATRARLVDELSVDQRDQAIRDIETGSRDFIAWSRRPSPRRTQSSLSDLINRTETISIAYCDRLQSERSEQAIQTAHDFIVQKQTQCAAIAAAAVTEANQEASDLCYNELSQLRLTEDFANQLSDACAAFVQTRTEALDCTAAADGFVKAAELVQTTLYQALSSPLPDGWRQRLMDAHQECHDFFQINPADFECVVRHRGENENGSHALRAIIGTPPLAWTVRSTLRGEDLRSKCSGIDAEILRIHANDQTQQTRNLGL